MIIRMYSIRNRLNLPETSGVYFLFSKNELLYIGKAKNLKKRINQHFGNGYLQRHIVNPEEINKIMIRITKDEFDAERIKSYLLKLLPTKFNKNWFCNKEYYLDWRNQTGIFAVNDFNNELKIKDNCVKQNPSRERLNKYQELF